MPQVRGLFGEVWQLLQDNAEASRAPKQHAELRFAHYSMPSFCKLHFMTKHMQYLGLQQLLS